MGIPAEQFDRLVIAHRDFPNVPDDVLNRLSESSPYVSLALDQREVLKAAQRREEAARQSYRASREQLDPRVDVSLGAGYTGWIRGNGAGQLLSPFDREVSGPSLSLTLSAQMPFQNRAAEGRAAQQKALHQRQKIQTRDAVRTIKIRVRATRQGVANSVRRVRETEESTNWHRSVVANEKKKYQLGESTLIDVIVAQNRLENSLSSHVRNRQSFAVELARFQLQTGTLLAFDGTKAVVKPSRLVTLPGVTETE
jgi:outer membrane protein TolC